MAREYARASGEEEMMEALIKARAQQQPSTMPCVVWKLVWGLEGRRVAVHLRTLFVHAMVWQKRLCT